MKPCPGCGSANLRRSRARNPREDLLMRLTPLRLYRCHDCNRRAVRLKPRDTAPPSAPPHASDLGRFVRILLVLAAVAAAMYFLISPYLDLAKPISRH